MTLSNLLGLRFFTGFMVSYVLSGSSLLFSSAWMLGQSQALCFVFWDPLNTSGFPLFTHPPPHHSQLIALCVCKLQYWDTSDQTTDRVEKQPHPSADKMLKDIWSLKSSLDTTPHEPAHHRVKAQPHSPVSRHQPLPSGSLRKHLEQPHPSGGRHWKQGD